MSSRLLARAKKGNEGPSGASIDIDRPNHIALELRGDIVAEYLGSLEAEITRLTATAQKFVILDFSNVEEIGSAGVGLFVALKKRFRASGTELVLAGLRPRHQKFIETLGFGNYFTSALDVESAIGYIENQSNRAPPLTVACPVCGSLAESKAPGRGRCRVCQAVYTIMGDGSVELG